MSASVACVFVVGLLLRLYCLDCHSLWGDEVASISVAQRGVLALLTDRFGWMRVQTPLHYLITWFALQVAHPATTSLFVRLPSALAGAFTVPATYALGRELFGARQGLLAAAILALSGAHIAYSQDLRPYTMLALLTVLSIYCLLRAVRSGSGGWWTAFAVVATANILNSYTAITIVSPTVLPLYLWAIWRIYRGCQARGLTGATCRMALFAAVAFCATGAVGLLMLVDMLQVPRVAPDLSRLPLAEMVTSPLELFTWFTRFGFDPAVERVTQLTLLLFSVIASYFAARRASAWGIGLCIWVMVAPASLLAIFGTTNTVFQRYALFVLPFYYLFISQAVIYVLSSLARFLEKRRAPVSTSPLVMHAAGKDAPTVYLVGMLVIGAIFGLGTLNFLSSGGPDNFVAHPDIKGLDNYLAQQVQPGDAVLFVGWHSAQPDFYWQGKPPAPSYNVEDPRAFTLSSISYIYWVVGFDGELAPGVVASNRWATVRRFTGAVVLRERYPGSAASNVRSSLEYLVSGMNGQNYMSTQQSQLILGSLDTARGDIISAVQHYRAAGSYFRGMGNEYLGTSKGYAARDQIQPAYLNALEARSYSPANASVHQWLGELLGRTGYEESSRAEFEVARLLDAPAH